MKVTDVQGLLPLGTVVTLKEGTKTIMVVGRIQENTSNGNLYDYAAVYYPEGIMDARDMFLFNHDDIDKVYYQGYQDVEEESFKQFIIGKMSELNMLEAPEISIEEQQLH